MLGQLGQLCHFDLADPADLAHSAVPAQSAALHSTLSVSPTRSASPAIVSNEVPDEDEKMRQRRERLEQWKRERVAKELFESKDSPGSEP
eukprot:jgi/Hompol1/6882/HPOL_000571-RA